MSIQPRNGNTNPKGSPAIVVLERRRSRRRHLRKPAEVALRYDGTGNGWHGTGDMLNLGADGVAVRLLRRDLPEAVTTGQTLRISFQPGDEGLEFDWACRVVNVTEGATPDHSVVGLEFIGDARSKPERERLLAVIGGTLEDEG